MNGNFASTPLTSNTHFNSSPGYNPYAGLEPISPLEARFPSGHNIGSGSRTQQMGQEASQLYAPQYPMARSDAENHIALQHAQAECSRLKQQLLLFETQKLEQANLEKYNSTGAKKKRQPNALRHYAQGFTFTTNFWTTEKASVIATTTIPADFDPMTRHTFQPTTPELARKHALYSFIWELDDYLPVECKYFLKNVTELEKFLSYAQTLRSELQNHVRSNASVLLSEFDDVTKEDYEQLSDPQSRTDNPQFQHLMSYNSHPTASNPQYPALCPLISRDGDEFPFGTDNIAKFLIIILFGKAQVRAEIPERHKGCNANNWGVNEVTPNMIAVAATMMRYLLSPDRTFTAAGLLSKVDWISTCASYRMLIITNKDTPGIISLFDTLNSRLFGGRAPASRRFDTPALDNAFVTPIDASLQSAITLLQSRREPQDNVSAIGPSRSTPTAGVIGLHGTSTPASLTPTELASASEDQAAAAFADTLISDALNAASDDDSSLSDQDDFLASLTASTSSQSNRSGPSLSRSNPTTENLQLLASTASNVVPSPALTPPTFPVPTSAPTIATAGRSSKRTVQEQDYADPDEDGNMDGPSPKKPKVTTAKNRKGGSGRQNASGAAARRGGGGGSRGRATAGNRKKR